MQEKIIQCSQENCDFESERIKDFSRLKKQWICKKCYRNIRLNHRKETIEITGIKKELQDLKYKQQLEKYGGRKGLREYQRKKYHEKNPDAEYYDKSGLPKINKAKKQKSSAFITLQERQDLLRILINNGMDFEDAKERIKELIECQKEVREKLRNQNKSEEEIIIKQKQMIDDLINF